MPWQVLTHNRASTLPKVMVFEVVRLDVAREATVHLTPAILPGEGWGSPSRVIFSRAREELVERALRKLAVSRLVATGPQPDPMGGNMTVSITFSIHQLRRELEENGHGFKFVDVREALDVMHLANVRVECPADSLVHHASGPVLGNLQSIVDPDDTDGKRSVYRATFHLIAAAAIPPPFRYPRKDLASFAPSAAWNRKKLATASNPLATKFEVSLKPRPDRPLETNTPGTQPCKTSRHCWRTTSTTATIARIQPALKRRDRSRRRRTRPAKARESLDRHKFSKTLQEAFSLIRGPSRSLGRSIFGGVPPPRRLLLTI